MRIVHLRVVDTWARSVAPSFFGGSERGKHNYSYERGILKKLDPWFRYLICVSLITLFLGCAATQQHESTGQYIDDSVITSKVKAAILDEPSLKVFQISVTTYQGVVKLSGVVHSVQMVKKAGEVAGTVGGVKEVKNELVVK